MNPDKPDHSKDTDLKPLEITSPRTAEEPGPQSAGPKAAPKEPGCCDTHAHPEAEDGHEGHAHSAQEAEASYLPTALTVGLLLSGLVLDHWEVDWFASTFLRLAWYGVAYALVGWRVLWHAVQNIRRGQVFNEFFLMGLATLGAFYVGEYAEGVTVMLFYVIGEHFQEAAVARSRKSIKALLDNRPDEVGLLREGKIVPTPAKGVRIGDTIELKAGEKVALDGELLTGPASFNTAALTGESKPDTKQKGDSVLAGMINQDKVIQLRVTAAYEDSALAKILQLVEQAGSRKAKTQQFITRFAKIYTPIVFFAALGLTLLPYFFVEHYVFNDWLYRALIFLVISCPCALVISIPLGYFGGIGAASRHGILFKGANFLDLMRQIDTVVMDKTGTLTRGVFQVQHVEAANGNTSELVAMTAALESRSTHPIAQAIVLYAQESHASLTTSEVEEISGHGLKGVVAGKTVLAGNGKLLKKFNVAYDPKLDAIVETIVLVAVEGQYAGYLTIADELKPDARQAVTELHALGVKYLVMLSGDKDSIVQQVARSLGIDQAFGGLLPQDKVAKVEQLKKQGRMVAFVGDGINDAPVITLADVGMAMGAMGSDAAIETADVVIQHDQPARIATAIRIGKATNSVVWQNISLAFGVKALVLGLGAFGVATMWEAVFADVGVALLAILNAVRIGRMKF